MYDCIRLTSPILSHNCTLSVREASKNDVINYNDILEKKVAKMLTYLASCYAASGMHVCNPILILRKKFMIIFIKQCE